MVGGGLGRSACKRWRRGFGPGQALSEFKASLSSSLPPSRPCTMLGIMPRGRAAQVATYKGAIELSSHSQSWSRRAGRPGGGRGQGHHTDSASAVAGGGERGQRQIQIYSEWFSAVSKKGTKATGLLVQSTALHLVLHKFAY